MKEHFKKHPQLSKRPRAHTTQYSRPPSNSHRSPQPNETTDTHVLADVYRDQPNSPTSSDPGPAPNARKLRSAPSRPLTYATGHSETGS